MCTCSLTSFLGECLNEDGRAAAMYCVPCIPSLPAWYAWTHNISSLPSVRSLCFYRWRPQAPLPLPCARSVAPPFSSPRRASMPVSPPSPFLARSLSVSLLASYAGPPVPSFSFPPLTCRATRPSSLPFPLLPARPMVPALDHSSQRCPLVPRRCLGTPCERAAHPHGSACCLEPVKRLLHLPGAAPSLLPHP